MQSLGGDAGSMRQIALRMAEALRHRGPDGYGAWVDPDSGVAISHRRLAVLDLSENGAQPMISESGRFVMSYNGEIYNHHAIRAQLEAAGGGMRWRGHSDTEVMLAAIERWGLREALGQFNGMFAIALWDREQRQLHLARDRFGEKPLYYSVSGRSVVFGSELGALKQYPGWAGEIDRDALTLFLRLKCIPAPYCIYRNIRKLPPAHLISFDVGAAPDSGPQHAVAQAYWDLQGTVDRALGRPFQGSADEAAEQLDLLLRDSVRLRMEADVPLGAFLSGGVDSSTIVALMQAQSSRPIRTFTIGFGEEQYNEAAHAARVACHLGTDHSNLYVSGTDALDCIPRLPGIYDEPFADPAQVPTYLLSRFARQHVTVSLSGDAGDELFGGYNRYLMAPRLHAAIRYLPRALRRSVAAALGAIPPSAWDTSFTALGRLLPARHRLPMAGDLIQKGLGLLKCDNVSQLYLGLISQWQSPADVVRDSQEPVFAARIMEPWASRLQWQHSMMALDAAWYLPSDVLVQLDRASMAVSLESRVPLLDPRVFEFAWSLPLGLKIMNATGKCALRQVLYKYVPRELIERPKMGFGMPIDIWLRGPLRDWAEALLDASRLEREGFFRAAPIRRKWQEHLSGTRNWHYDLWNVLMFQQWYEVQREPGR